MRGNGLRKEASKWHVRRFDKDKEVTDNKQTKKKHRQFKGKSLFL